MSETNRLNINITAQDAASARIRELQDHIKMLEGNIARIGTGADRVSNQLREMNQRAIAGLRETIASLQGEVQGIDQVTAALERQASVLGTVKAAATETATIMRTPAFIRPQATLASTEVARAAPGFIRPPTPVLPSVATHRLAEEENRAIDARTRMIREQMQLNNMRVRQETAEEERKQRLLQQEAEYHNRNVDLIKQKERAEAEYINRGVTAAEAKARAEAEYENKHQDLVYRRQRAEAEIENAQRNAAERMRSQSAAGIIAAHSPGLAAAQAAGAVAARGGTTGEAQAAGATAAARALQEQARAASAVTAAMNAAKAAGASEAEIVTAGARAATAALMAQGEAARVAGGGSGVLNREMRHVVGVFDAFARGQFGAMFSSIGAGLRDAGVGATALAGSIGGLIAFMGARAILHGAESMGKWATETRAAASAAGMSLPNYSQLQGALTLLGLKANEADAALRRFADNVAEAMRDSTSKAADGLHALGISQEMIVQNGGNMEAMLKLVAGQWNNFADGANKSAAAEAIFGRGFEALIPLLQLGSGGFEALKAKALELGITLNDNTATALESTGRKADELAASVRGNAIQAFIAWGPTIEATIGKLERLGNILSAILGPLAQVNSIIGRITSAPTDLASWLSKTGQSVGHRILTGLGLPDYNPLRAKEEAEKAAGVIPEAADAQRDRMSRRAVPSMPVHKGEETALGAMRDRIAQQSELATRGMTNNTKMEIRASEVAIAEMQKTLKEAQLTTRERETLETELANKQMALRRENNTLANQGASTARAQARQDYGEFANAERLKIQEANGSSTQIKAIYDEWLAAVDSTYKKGLESVRKYTIERERLERESLQKVSAARVKELEEEQKFNLLRMRAMKVAGEAERLQTGKPESPATAASYRAEAAQVESAMQEMVQAQMEALKTYQQGSPEYKKAAEEILQTIISAKQEEVSLYKKAAEESKKYLKDFENAFDQIGSSIEKGIGSILEAVISPSHTIYKVGLTSIRESNMKAEIGQALGNMFKSALSSITGAVGHALSHAIAGALSGGTASSIGELLGNWLSKGLSSITGGALGGAVGGAAASAPTVAAITTSTATLVATLTAGFSSLEVALSAIALKPSFAGFSFAGGGIVPSAAGGMVSGGVGGTLAILHAREMVLPRHLSEGIQNMISQGGASSSSSYASNANLTFAPIINSSGKGRGASMTRSDMGEMLSTHGGAMLGELRTMMSRGWRPQGVT